MCVALTLEYICNCVYAIFIYACFCVCGFVCNFAKDINSFNYA